MTVSVRQACYESETQLVIAALQRNLPHLPHAKLFPWLYLRNPEGRALVWVAFDSGTNDIIGVAAAFPRRIYCEGRQVRGYVLGDFCIDSGHRSLGLALALERACLEGISIPGGAFAFDFPSQTMLAVYRRLGIEANLNMVRYAIPLRVDRKIAEHVPVRAAASGLSLVVNAGLRFRGTRRKVAADWTIGVEAGPWQEEFSRAAGEWSGRTGACVFRTADYLNWRYREHPLETYEMVTARQNDKLLGYLILHMKGEGCVIDDMLAESDLVCSALLREAVGLARQRGVHTVSAPWLSTHLGRQVLEQCGFRPRESRPVVLLPLSQAIKTDVEPSNAEWYLTSGDWES